MAQGGRGPGVLLRIIQRGCGDERRPRNGDVCVINYSISRDSAAGEMFDERHKTQPYSFKVGSKVVLPALENSIKTLKVGDVAEVFIPSHYAYGLTGSPPWIPPAADLFVWVALLDIA